MSINRFFPTVYDNQREIITPADLGNHPRATEYIREYLNLVRWPVDFPTWLNRMEIAERRQAEADRDYIKRLAAGPIINACSINRFKRKK